jgi:hypothetical protein
MGKKVSTQLLVSPHTRDRSRALAIVRHESVAEVNRVALEGGGLAPLEDTHKYALERLDVALAGMRVDRSEALEKMLKHKLLVSNLYHDDGTTPRKRFPHE